MPTTATGQLKVAMMALCDPHSHCALTLLMSADRTQHIQGFPVGKFINSIIAAPIPNSKDGSFLSFMHRALTSEWQPPLAMDCLLT